VRPGDLDKTEHAMNSLVASVAWDEARFGLALDLERFMIVAVEDFNMGAMENKGLNIFNTKYVLANPATATDADFAASRAWSPTSTSTTGPATASPAATGSSCR
jgi:aminopeptidase N